MERYLRLYRYREGSYYPGTDRAALAIEESLAVLVSKRPPHKGRKEQMRIPVVDSRGVPQMPCAPGKARHLFKSGKARPKWSKLGLFLVQLCYEQEPDPQPLVVGIDPGSKFEGFSVVGAQETVLNLMVEAPTHVKN